MIEIGLSFHVFMGEKLDCKNSIWTGIARHVEDASEACLGIFMFLI